MITAKNSWAAAAFLRHSWKANTLTLQLTGCLNRQFSTAWGSNDSPLKGTFGNVGDIFHCHNGEWEGKLLLCSG